MSGARITQRTDAEERRRWFEIWHRVDGGLNGASTWMVWEIGPVTGGEHWFSSEEDARAFVDAAIAEQERA